MPFTVHTDVIDYAEVRRRLAAGRAHLLLGNGFSVGCDPIFTYPSLFDAAVGAGLSEKAQRVFAYLGTNNFEGVMRLLDDAHFAAITYELIDGPESPMHADLEIVKQTLVEAIARSHPAHTGEIPDEKSAPPSNSLIRITTFSLQTTISFCTG